jgi:hypothetical protein
VLRAKRQPANQIGWLGFHDPGSMVELAQGNMGATQ